jgi:segregation and condensation protein B
MAPAIDRTQLKLVIESVLFVAEGPVELRTLARLAEVTPDEVAAAIAELAAESKTRGVRVQTTGNRVQLSSAPETTPYVQRFLGIDENQRLSATVLATLTVIAYKQPVTKGTLERILKKSCDYSVDILKTRELIAEVGRADGPGRPYLYGTTFKFLEHFGLEKPEDLPPLPELEVAAAAAPAEDEDALPEVEELPGEGATTPNEPDGAANEVEGEGEDTAEDE